MTMSFADQVQRAVKDAEETPETDPAQQYRAVLDELARGLTALGVGARIQPGRDPRKLSLHLYPIHQPARVNLMLSFFLDGDAIIVAGERTTRIEKPGDLERWLLDFVRLPAFMESLDILRGEAEQPVEGRLRVDARSVYMKGDVMVRVSKEDQEKLDATEIGGEVDLAVERIDFPGNAQFGDVNPYAVLDSAGLLVNDLTTTQDGAKLRIQGRRAA